MFWIPWPTKPQNQNNLKQKQTFPHQKQNPTSPPQFHDTPPLISLISSCLFNFYAEKFCLLNVLENSHELSS